jgi:hypothetical protein
VESKLKAMVKDDATRLQNIKVETQKYVPPHTHTEGRRERQKG